MGREGTGLVEAGHNGSDAATDGAEPSPMKTASTASSFPYHEIVEVGRDGIGLARVKPAVQESTEAGPPVLRNEVGAAGLEGRELPAPYSGTGKGGEGTKRARTCGDPEGGAGCKAGAGSESNWGLSALGLQKIETELV